MHEADGQSFEHGQLAGLIRPQVSRKVDVGLVIGTATVPSSPPTPVKGGVIDGGRKAVVSAVLSTLTAPSRAVRWPRGGRDVLW